LNLGDEFCGDESSNDLHIHGRLPRVASNHQYLPESLAI
jgi:hypothetical protein